MDKKKKSLVALLHSAVDALEPAIGDEYFSVSFHGGAEDFEAQIFGAPSVAELAAAHNAELAATPFGDGDYPFELSAVINGVKFSQLATAAEAKAAGVAENA